VTRQSLQLAAPFARVFESPMTRPQPYRILLCLPHPKIRPPAAKNMAARKRFFPASSV
jgi:hypothetical protein